MGTDGLVYKREASEQDDSVEDLVNITKGKCLCVICRPYCILVLIFIVYFLTVI